MNFLKPMDESNNVNYQKIAFGGGCHWCTEAVFQSLKGVSKVEQGFVACTGTNQTFSEAVLVHFDPATIALHELIEIHLHTHKSTSDHSMRLKYLSAIYAFSSEQAETIQKIVNGLQSEFEQRLVTKVLPFKDFNPSKEQFVNYYYKNPQKPFCLNYIAPKLQMLAQRYPKLVKQTSNMYSILEGKKVGDDKRSSYPNDNVQGRTEF